MLTTFKNDKGFTLIELLIVIAIIGILAAIAVPIFLSQQTNAQQAAAESEASALESLMLTGASLGIDQADLNQSGTTYDLTSNYGSITPAQSVGSMTIQDGTFDTVYTDPNNYCVSVAINNSSVVVSYGLGSSFAGPDQVCP